MPRTTRIAALAVAAAAGLAVGPAAWAFAPVELSSYRYAFSEHTVELMWGESATVELYLVETVTTGTSLPGLENEAGLLSVGVRVERDLGQAGQPIADVTGASYAGVAFPLQTPSFVPGTFDVLLELAPGATEGVLPSLTAGERWIKLADLTFTAVNLNDLQAPILFRATDRTGGLDETLTFDQSVLDEGILEDTLLVNVVHTPEPGALAMLGAGLMMVLPRRRRSQG